MDVANPHASRAVLIGTGTYSRMEDIRSVAANLEDVRAALTDPDLWGLPPENITEIADGVNPKEIYQALRAAATTTREDGLLVIYFAGHGLPHDRDLVLGLRDTDPQFPDDDGLRYAKIREAIQLSVTLQRLVILDCCYAGRAGREMLAGGDALRQLADRAEVEQALLLVAAGPNEPARAPMGARNTAFTGALMQVLRKGSETPEPVLTVRTVFDEVARTLAAAGHPRPELRESNSAGDLPFVRNVRVRQRNLTAAVLGAAPNVTDPELRDSIILVLRHDTTGALGVRLNRPIGDLPPALEGWRKHVSVPASLFDGGPIARDGFIALVRLRAGEADPIRFTRIKGTLGSLPLTETQPFMGEKVADMRIFTGYLGWGPGALERLVGEKLLHIISVSPSRATFGDGPSRFDPTS
ncbi:YqgE/AlgH family protein [Actinoplanes sp. CA-054009]